MAKQESPSYFKIIGRNLKSLRLEHGHTQKHVANILGVSFQQVQKYETGKNKLPIENLFLLKTYYGANFEEFFSGLGNNFQKSGMHEQEDERRTLSRLVEMRDQVAKRKILKIIRVLLA